MPSFEVIAGSSVEEIGVNLKDMMGNMFGGARQDAPFEGAGGARTAGGRGAVQAARHGVGQPDGGAARRAGRHHLRGRDRQDRQPRRRRRWSWARRQPRRRAARHPADRRGHDGQHEARDGQDRPHPVHRRRRVPRLEAVGSDSGAAGPVSDPRRARAADARRLRPHPDRAAQRAGEAVRGAARHRGTGGDVHAGRRRADRRLRRPRQRHRPRTSAPADCTP